MQFDISYINANKSFHVYADYFESGSNKLCDFSKYRK